MRLEQFLARVYAARHADLAWPWRQILLLPV